MATFVLEIGSEELPSRFLRGEEDFLRTRFAAELTENAVSFGSIDVTTTPRRAVVVINDLSPVQEERDEEVSGPPARVAWKDGKPTKALEGFARTCGVDISAVYSIKTPKGEYVAAKKHTGGAPSAQILASVCPGIITQIPFAKRMHWGAHQLAYARPLHWILALLDDAVVEFEVGPVKSGRSICGHRIHGRGPFEFASAADYLATAAEKCGIVQDREARKAIVVEGGNKQAAAIGGRVLWNDALLEEVAGLAEHPVPLLADFDERYLEVPREVLITSMQTHQKSFGVEDADGKLLPHFVTVLNLDPEDISVVKHGWERVLRARLEDARFFWHEDLKLNFETWLEKLDHVIFIRGLGTMGEKTRRLEKLCTWIAERCAPDAVADAARAGRLSKADLVSGMVGEFDTLQGVMGGIYAARMGETAAAAQAVGEQYLPAGPDTALPKSVTGAILSVADRADTLAGCFGLGMIPTGAADPNALRRCALGIIRILREFGFSIDVRELFAAAQAGYEGIAWKLAPADALAKLEDFFAGRLRVYYQQTLGCDTLLVDAALGADRRNVPGVDARIRALQTFAARPEYAQDVQTFKRVANIVKKQRAAGVVIPETWKDGLLAEEPEKALAAVLGTVLPQLDSLWDARDYAGILAALGSLRPTVDAFFNGVMVACDDEALRANRLAMLSAMADRFARVADFAALQI